MGIPSWDVRDVTQLVSGGPQRENRYERSGVISNLKFDGGGCYRTEVIMHKRWQLSGHEIPVGGQFLVTSARTSLLASVSDPACRITFRAFSQTGRLSARILTMCLHNNLRCTEIESLPLEECRRPIKPETRSMGFFTTIPSAPSGISVGKSFKEIYNPGERVIDTDETVSQKIFFVLVHSPGRKWFTIISSASS